MSPVKKKTTPRKRKKKLSKLPLSRPVTPGDIMDRARQYGPACIDTLADVAANGNDAARVSAAGTLLDRGFGKVKQEIGHTISAVAEVTQYQVPDNGRD